MTRKTLFDVAKYLLAIGLLVWVVKSNWAPPAQATEDGAARTGGLSYVWQHHAVEGHPIRAGSLLAGFAIYLVVAGGLTMLRWYVLVRALDLPLSLRDAFRYGMIGVFFNTFLPGAVGGDVIKAAALASGQKRRTAAVATVLMDRVLGLWALVWFVAILGSVFWAAGMLEGPSAGVASSVVTGALITVGVTLAVWLGMGLFNEARAERVAGGLQRLPFVGAAVAELWRSGWTYRQRPGSVSLALALSWVGNVGLVITFYCCANVLWSEEMGAVPSLTSHYLLVPLGLVMQALIPTPGGAGAGEWGFGALYALFDAAEANGVLASLVLRTFTWVLGLVGYLFYLWTKPSLAPAAQSTQAERRAA